MSVALNTELSDELRIEGVARELVNRIQGARRDLDLNVTDRIDVTWSAADVTIADAFSAYAELISGEVLAQTITRGDNEGIQYDIGGVSARISVTQ